MANVTNTLIANITATEDTSQNVIINRTVPNLIFDSTVAVGVVTISLTAAYVVLLPAVNCYQLYVRNADNANDVTVNMTGTATMGVRLKPGAALFLWQNPASGTPFTGLTLTPSANPCLTEYFIGA